MSKSRKVSCSVRRAKKPISKCESETEGIGNAKPADSSTKNEEEEIPYAHAASICAASLERLAAMLRNDWKEGEKFPNALAFAFTDLLNVFRFFDEAGRDSIVRSYLHIASVCITLVNHFSVKWPDAVKSFVEPGIAWPVLMDGTLAGMKREEERLRQLGIIRKGRSFSYETPEVQVATKLYVFIRNYQQHGWGVWMPREWNSEGFAAKVKKLTPLNRERGGLQAWWKVAEPMFCCWWGKDFENREPFLDWGKRDAYKGMQEREKRSAIRRDIKQSIKQALKSVAPR